jgi:hypothetical protein
MIIPGVYDIRRKGGVYIPPEPPTKVNFVTGTAKRGTLNKVIIGTFDTIANKVESGDIYDFCYRAYLNGANNFHVVVVKGANAAKASKTFKKTDTDAITITAANEGAWGNDLSVKISEDITGTRTYHFKYGTNLIGSVLAVQSNDALVEALGNDATLSEYVVATKLTADLPDTTENYVSLAGGADGDAVTNTNIIGTYNPTTGVRTGLQLAIVDPDWFNIATATLEGDASINAAMITICENRNYGKALLTHLIGATDDEIKTAAEALNSPNGRASYWAGYYESYAKKGSYVSPIAAVMGILCKNEVFVSPSNNYITDALSLKKAWDDSQIESFLLRKINVVGKGIRDASGRVIKTIHSYNKTTDPDLIEVQYTATYDAINRRMRDAISWAISKPNTAELQRQLQGSMELVQHWALNEPTSWGNGIIKDMWVKVTEASLPDTLYCDWGVLFIGAAHYIINRSTVSPTSLESTILREQII